jgi:hypothetical protein
MQRRALLALFLGICSHTWAQPDPFGRLQYFGDFRDPANPWAQFKIQVPQSSGVRAPVSGAPYSAEEQPVIVQIRADGTRTVDPGARVTTYRDSAGRMRVDSLYVAPNAAEQRFSQIQDPVAGFYYFIEPRNKIVYRMKYNGPSPQPLRPRQQSVGPNQVSLGKKLFNGVEAEGVRTTTNGTNTSETWFAPRLGVTVLYEVKRPDGGNKTELVNLSAIEPSASVFLLPSGYQVEDKTEAFTVEVGKRP